MSNLFDVASLQLGDIESLLDRAGIHADHLAAGRSTHQSLVTRVVTTVFFEPSTRTRLSFERAARVLGADVMTFVPETSSVLKGESLADTAKTLAAIGTDAFVVRHTVETAADEVHAATGLPVVNGGTGRSEHPTQTLADLLALSRRFDEVSGLSIGIVGDIVNSRVAKSNIVGFGKMGAKLTLIGPTDLLPPSLPGGVSSAQDFDAVLPSLDVVYMLRIQRERGAQTGFENDAEYKREYGLDQRRADLLPPTAVVMHPGPMNRGVEIEGVVADGQRSLIEAQVAMGVPMRMAVLEKCLEVRP